ncbi:PREDICTED: uncharacterized protein LOC106751836 [Dinoponera quadriceps]|uniref:Uncharacterized protein LOC106751836 n=1 Tax=Dinoponera quadriceps TaxID=609295 RepID=A0A6P3YF56_DINQU|nr:PREDICTED: uncharacterized protein LOC106751836 [Dinoponera quadriceps]
MPRNMMDMETMELYKKIPARIYKDSSYLCSNCDFDCEEIHDSAAGKKKMENYERHCPSCYCPFDRRRLSLSDRSRTWGNITAMLNQYEGICANPNNLSIKKSQSSPLSQKVCWNDYQMSTRLRYPKRLPQIRQPRRRDYDKYFPSVFRGDMVNSDLANEDVEICSKYVESIPTKSTLKKHSDCRKFEVGTPDEQEYSDTGNEVLMNYAQKVYQFNKSYASNCKSRYCIGRDSKYVTETKIEGDADRRQNEHDYQKKKKADQTLGDFEKQKYHKAPVIIEDNEKNHRRKFDVEKTMKPKIPDDDSHCTTSKSFVPVKESIDKSDIDKAREIISDGPAHLAKLDLYSTKSYILESIDHMLGTMSNVKNLALQQEQTDGKMIEKMTREFQENGWQLLLNALTIHQNSTDSDKRTVRLECLNHIQQELVKLYALESILDNCPPAAKQQSSSSHNIPCSEER